MQNPRPLEDSKVEASVPLTPSITALIPTRGRPESVIRAVRSVQRQTLRVAEILVIVDGPDERTVTNLAALDEPALRIVQLPVSRGPAGARNAGVVEARGEWLALLDDDDEWLPDKLTKQWAAASPLWHSSNTPVIACAAYWHNEQGTFVWPRRSPGGSERLADYLFVRTQPGEGLLATPTLFLPTELARRHPFPEHLSVHEDFDWLLELESAGAAFRVLLEPLVRVEGSRNRSSASRSNVWARSLAWALARQDDLGPRAFSGFLLTEVARNLAPQRQLFASLGVLNLALTGRPRSRDVLRFIAIHLLDEEKRWRLGRRIWSRAGE